MTMSGTEALTPNPKVIHTQLGEGQAVLLHLETHKYYSLNATGRLVWDLLGQGETQDALSSRIAEEYGIPVERAAADVKRIVRQLSDAGLLLKK